MFLFVGRKVHVHSLTIHVFILKFVGNKVHNHSFMYMLESVENMVLNNF